MLWEINTHTNEAKCSRTHLPANVFSSEKLWAFTPCLNRMLLVFVSERFSSIKNSNVFHLYLYLWKNNKHFSVSVCLVLLFSKFIFHSEFNILPTGRQYIKYCVGVNGSWYFFFYYTYIYFYSAFLAALYSREIIFSFPCILGFFLLFI